MHFSAVWLKDLILVQDFTRKIPRQWHHKSYLYRISSSDSISHSEWHLGILDICAEGMGFQKVIFPFFCTKTGEDFYLAISEILASREMTFPLCRNNNFGKPGFLIRLSQMRWFSIVRQLTLTFNILGVVCIYWNYYVSLRDWSGTLIST